MSGVELESRERWVTDPDGFDADAFIVALWPYRVPGEPDLSLA
ncbi:hypothetical protein [Actinomyces trachealis]|nr:hypothetical protein [Actinomyces trachealis]